MAGNQGEDLLERHISRDAAMEFSFTMSTSDRSESTIPLASDSSTDVNKATTIINAFMPWLLIVAGSVCNILIILGMRSKSFRSLSTSVYMTVGAVNDLTSLNICLVAHWLHLNFPEAIARGEGSVGICRFYNFYGWGQADFGIMLTSVMTADRAYAILHPMTRVDLIKRAKIVIVICVIVVIIKEFHFLFTSVIVDLGRKDRMCDVNYNNSGTSDFYLNYWPWIDTTFVTFCFMCIVISNTILIVHVRRNRMGRQLQTLKGVPASNGTRLSISDSRMSIHGKNYETVATQVTRMLFAESLFLILLSYPFSVHLIVMSQIEDLQQNPDTKKVNALVFNIVFYLLYANKCVNFIVYCLVGKRFRKVIMTEVLSCLKFNRNIICTGKVHSDDFSGNPRSHSVRSEKDKNNHCSTISSDT